MSSKRLQFQGVVLVFLLAKLAESAVLSTSSRVIEVNKSVTFNCSSVNFEAEGVRYFVKGQSGDQFLTIIFFQRNGQCRAFGIDQLPINISFFCVNSTLFSLEIHKLTMDFHNTSFYCEVYNNENISYKSADVVIEVAVPVKGTKIVGSGESAVTVTTTEHNVTRLTCTTTPSYPAPIVKWYRNSGQSSSAQINTENIFTSEKHGEYHLIITESTLKLNVSRAFNGSSIYCTASNGFGDELFVNSSHLQLLVQYPPSEPEFLVETMVIENTINVIKGKMLSISCRSDGYPPPSFFWIRQDNVISTKKLLTIPSVDESHNGAFVCKVNNTMKWNHVGKSEKGISLTILVPPSRPVLYLNGSSENVINYMMHIVKNDSFTVICKSIGVPTPVCGWNEYGASKDILTEMLVQNDLKRTCRCSNDMVETIGERKSLSVNATLDVKVLYPPNTPTIQLHTHSQNPQIVTDILTVEEFTSFNLTCSAVSKPDVNIYTWSGQVNIYSNNVILNNISRNEDGLYTCHASNVMHRSFGKVQIGQSNKTVSVQIVYEAKVTEFLIVGHDKDNPVIRNQMESATFQCSVDSNPSPSTSLQFKDKLLVNGTNNRNLTYFIRNISCNDAGIYDCYSSNQVNRGKFSKKQLTLIVKCLPYPSVDKPPISFVDAPVSGSALLRFHAAPYHDPGITYFRWFKLENDRRILLRNGTRTYISSSDIHTVLQINNILDADYGMYLLEYNNTVGMNNFTFYLQEIGVPPVQIPGAWYAGIGSVLVIFVIVGVILGIVIYRKRCKKKTESGIGDRSYDNVCEMNAKTDGNNTTTPAPVYEGLKPVEERGCVEKKEQTYDRLNPNKVSSDDRTGRESSNSKSYDVTKFMRNHENMRTRHKCRTCGFVNSVSTGKRHKTTKDRNNRCFDVNTKLASDSPDSKDPIYTNLEL